MDKVVELVGGGSVINGATPSSFKGEFNPKEISFPKSNRAYKLLPTPRGAASIQLHIARTRRLKKAYVKFWFIWEITTAC